jgi:hypothetical protein
MKKHPHETTVLGLFKSADQAHRAMDALEGMSVSHEDISLVANKEAYEREELVKFIAGEKLHEEAVRAGKVGGLTGAVLAGATIITGILTGGGSLLAAGPLIAVVTGAGGLLGGLLGTGFTEEEAKSMDQAIAQGEVLVVVHAVNRKLGHEARDMLRQQGAERVHLHH